MNICEYLWIFGNNWKVVPGRYCMSHWGLYIIRVNHSLKGTLNEDELRVRTKPALGYRSQIPTLSADRRWTCPGSVNLIPFFPYFPVFDTLNAIRALRSGWWKYTLFTRFYLRGWCTGPNETYPPPETMLKNKPHLVNFDHGVIVSLWTFQPTLVVTLLFSTLVHE